MARYAPEGVVPPGSSTCNVVGANHRHLPRATRMNSYMNVRTVRSIEPNVERTSSGWGFVRFAAAMQAEPPPTEQIRDERTRAQLLPAPSAADSTVSRSMEARHRSNPWIPWLGIGSWALLCAALFISLLSSHDRELLQRDGGTTSDPIQSPATVSNALRAADRNQPTPMLEELLPKEGHKMTTEARPDLDSSAPAQPAEPRLEKAGLFAGGVDARVPGGPPLPRQKPHTN